MAAVWTGGRSTVENQYGADGLYLDDLCHSVGEFALRQGLQKGSIDENVFRLPECADEVFAVRRVYGGLSADARVYHCEQGRWNLAKLDSAHAMKGCEG